MTRPKRRKVGAIALVKRGRTELRAAGEMHLTSAYRKLDVSSRAELSAALAEAK